MVIKVDPEQQDWLETNIGSNNCEILKSFNKDDVLFFMKLWKSMDLKTSYFIHGTAELLDKFRAFYLSRCNNMIEVRKYGEMMLSDYARYLATTSEDDISIPEILFLRAHSHEIGYGKTEEWLSTVLVDNLANRRLKGYITIILSEREIPAILKAQELKHIDLKRGIVKKVSNTTNNSSGSEYL